MNLTRRGFLGTLAALATAVTMPAFAMCSPKKYGLIVAGEKPWKWRKVRCWLNGEEVTNVTVAANDAEGWADVLPFHCRKQGLSHLVTGAENFDLTRGESQTRDDGSVEATLKVGIARNRIYGHVRFEVS